MIICNNQEGGGLFELPQGDVGNQVNIPTISMSFTSCSTLKAVLDQVSIQVSFPEDLSAPNPGSTGLDSDYDNLIIVHEYTHGISNRLTGGPNTTNCLFSSNNFEQAGEGWSDWFGLTMTTTSDMTAEQRRGVGTYVQNQPPNGPGIRPFPYSRLMSINPHTYGDINSVSVPHGVGSIFAAAMWDLYWNLVDKYGFDDNLYTGNGGNNRAMQLVLDGLNFSLVIQPSGFQRCNFGSGSSQLWRGK